MIVETIEYANNVSVEVRGVTLLSINEHNIPPGISESVFTGKGVILVGTAEGAFIALPPGPDGEYVRYNSVQAAGVESGVPTIEVQDTTNYLVNPGWDFAQEQTPGTLTTIADGGYGGDQWKCYRENAGLQYRQVDASGESGLTSPYYGEYKKITNAGKILICQPLEYMNTVRFRGKALSFQLQMKANAAKTVRIAIIELASGGTADTIPAVVSAWGADGVNPTLGANMALIGTPTECSVTTTWQTFQFTGAFPSNSKNLLVAIWSDADMAANDTLGLAEAGLHFGSSVQSWTPIDTDEQIQKIRRFVWKTFPLHTAPVQNGGTVGAFHFNATRAGAATNINTVRMPISMRASPTSITLYNSSAANAQVRDSSVGADCTATASHAGRTSQDEISIIYTGAAGTAVGNSMDVHILAKAQL